MIVYDETLTKQLVVDELDFNKGRIEQRQRVVSTVEGKKEIPFRSAKEIAEQKRAEGKNVLYIDGEYYLATKMHANGGIMAVKIVDEEYSPAVDAYDKTEEVSVFVPYTDDEIEQNEITKLRKQRETECFSVINRGKLWYGLLSNANLIELEQWYIAWLNVTETKVAPTKPSWLDKKLEIIEEEY